MAKRANGEGSIYQRETDKRWVGSVTLENGRRKYLYGNTRQEVARQLTATLKARDDGLPIPSEQHTVRQFLSDWLEAIKPSLRQRTWDRYEQYVRVHALQDIGGRSLAKLTPQDLQRLYARRLEAGCSPTTVSHLHAVLHRALEQATRWGMVARNVADLVDPPRMARHDMRTLSPEEARTLLSAAEGDRLEALFTLALSTGMRQGELLALRWRDVDLERGALQVRGTLQRSRKGLTVGEPKTNGSRRQIILSKLALEALQRHRIRQNEERLRLGPTWEDQDLVFANGIGHPLEGRNMVRYFFEPLLKKAGLPPMRFHDLRHTAATLLLGQGIHPKIVSEMLGHSQIGITLDLYSHITPTMQQQAVEEMDRVLRR